LSNADRNRDQPPLPILAFIGLGQMGARMAARLAQAGYELRVYDREASTVAAFVRRNRAIACTSPRDCGLGAAIVITMLPDGDAVRSVVLGRSGVASKLTRGAIVVDMSSSDPVDTCKLGAVLARRGIKLVDAPVSGRIVGARDGTLTIMAGGERTAIKRVRPVLDVIGSNIFLTGALGTGHAVKTLNNYIAAVGTIAAFEALVIARKAGIDPGLFADLCNVSTGRNSTTENKIRQQILSGAYASGFGLSLYTKDVGITARLARELGISMPLLPRTLSIWRAANRKLASGSDHTRIYQYLDEQAGGRRAQGKGRRRP